MPTSVRDTTAETLVRVTSSSLAAAAASASSVVLVVEAVRLVVGLVYGRRRLADVLTMSNHYNDGDDDDMSLSHSCKSIHST